MSNAGENGNSWPTEDEIRKHAYEIFRARRGDEPGNDLDDWLAAEAQLRAAGKSTMQLANRSADVM
jgi:hypothetical protein